MTTEYSREELINLLKAYKRQIDRDNGEYPAVVLDDIDKSITHVLRSITE
jgi:hypothetical protein